MIRLHFVHPHRLSKLHDEILAAVPTLRPMMSPDGTLEAAMTVESRGDEIWLTVPDATAEPAITAVVAAHDPTPLPGPPVPDYGGDATTIDQVAAGVTQLRAYLALPAPTAAQSTAALKLAIRGLLFLLRRVI